MLKVHKTKKLSVKPAQSSKAGFTLMEIVVATAIFALLAASIMALFNYTLKINRRADALRQATQGARNFVEFLVKEIRNGQIDYSVNNETVQDPISPCPKPKGPGMVAGVTTDGSASYELKENRLGIINVKGERECFYLATSTVGSEAWAGFNNNKGKYLMMNKETFDQPENLNPQNFTLDELTFFIRPLNDPYADRPDVGNTGAGFAKVQPAVQISMKFTVTLPTTETVTIYYQTAVSINKYDIPNRLN